MLFDCDEGPIRCLLASRAQTNHEIIRAKVVFVTQVISVSFRDDEEAERVRHGDSHVCNIRSRTRLYGRFHECDRIVKGVPVDGHALDAHALRILPARTMVSVTLENRH
jgi:hypothetical protein